MRLITAILGIIFMSVFFIIGIPFLALTSLFLSLVFLLNYLTRKVKKDKNL